MNPCRTLPIALLALMPLAVRAATIEMHVNGLVCAFCAQGIEKKLRKLPATARSGKFRAWRHVRFRIAEIERVTPPPGGTHTAPRGRRHCMDVPAHRPHHAHRARAASHQAARGVLRRLPRARHLSLRHVTPHRAGSARTDRRGVRNTDSALEPDALLTVREEGRRSGGGRSPKAARGPTVSAALAP